MAKRLFFIGVMLLLHSTLFVIDSDAQVKIGYFSYDTVLKSMSEYRMAQVELDKLRAQYEEETKRAEEEFNAKYEDFLDNLSTLATSIRRKRQTELQQMMEINVNFRNEAKRLILQAEEDVMAPVKKHLNDAIAVAARDNGFIVVLNTDGNACPYIDPAWGEDITPYIINALK